ncbi:MAG: aminopeptidase N, partial [Pseudomonadota bacterium]
MRTETPVQIKLADYKPYPFAIDQVEMEFDLEPDATKVRTTMQVQRLSAGDLVLDGVEVKLEQIAVNGTILDIESFDHNDESLTVKNVPDRFTLETIVTI